MVTVRVLKEEDIPQVLDMSKLFHAQTTYPFPYNKDSWERTVRHCAGTSLVAVDGSVVVGILIVGVTMALWNYNMKQGTEIAFYLDEAYRGTSLGKKMIAKAELLCQLNGAVSLSMASMASEKDPVFNRYYSRMGYNKKEIIYLKEI